MPKQSLPQQKQIEVLVDIWRDRSNRVVYSLEATEEGRWVDRQMQRCTNAAMLIFLLVQCTTPFFVYVHPLISGIPIEPYPVSFVGLVLSTGLLISLGVSRLLPATIIRVTMGRLQVDDVGLEKFLAGHYRHAGKPKVVAWVLDRWRDLLFVDPFGFRYVWWWALSLGLAASYMEYIRDMKTGETLPPHIWSLHMNELAISVFRAFIIGIIGYIATNILRELLHLRDRYTEGAGAVENLTKQMKKFVPMIDQAYNALGTAASALDGTGGFQELLRQASKGKDSPFRGQIERLLMTTAGQTGNFVKQIREPADTEIKVWMLSTLNSCIAKQSEILNTTSKHLLTRFTNLGRIVGDLVGATFPPDASKSAIADSGIEFYALLVISPSRFLNFRQGQSIGDTDWEGYLESNIDASGRGILQKRYFLSITGLDGHRREVSEEVAEIEKALVMRQLSYWVGMKNDRPIKDPPDAEGRQRYRIKDASQKGECEQLSAVIGRLYHAPGCCFVRELDLQDYDQLLKDPATGKPLDYYAIRKDGKWRFCLQTAYDRGFDMADVQILHDNVGSTQGEGDWERIKRRLDDVFFSDTIGKTVAIENYGEFGHDVQN